MVSSNIDDCEWIMNSRCSFHMTSNSLCFQEFTKIEGGSSLLGDSKSCKIIIIGTTKFRLYDRIERTFEKVRFVARLKNNLISLVNMRRKKCI